MAKILFTSLAAGALASAALGLAGTASAAPSGPSPVDDTVSELQAKGFNVIVRVRVVGGALRILTICRESIEFLSGAADYRIGRLSPGPLLGKGPLFVAVRTIEIQFPRKGHSLPHIASRRQLAEDATAIFRDVV
jgi:hypothetical protein